MRPPIVWRAGVAALASLYFCLCFTAGAVETESERTDRSVIERLQEELAAAQAEAAKYKEIALKNKEVALKLKSTAEGWRTAYQELKEQHDELESRYQSLNKMWQTPQRTTTRSLRPPAKNYQQKLFSQAGASPNSAGILRNHFTSDKGAARYFYIGTVSSPKLVDYGGGAWLVTFQMKATDRGSTSRNGMGYAFIRNGRVVRTRYALENVRLWIPAHRDGSTAKHVASYYLN